MIAYVVMLVSCSNTHLLSALHGRPPRLESTAKSCKVHLRNCGTRGAARATHRVPTAATIERLGGAVRAHAQRQPARNDNYGISSLTA